MKKKKKKKTIRRSPRIASRQVITLDDEEVEKEDEDDIQIIKPEGVLCPFHDLIDLEREEEAEKRQQARSLEVWDL